jgi:hypothetical protein
MTGESLASILVVLSCVIPTGHYSSGLNFSGYISEKVDRRLIVIFSGQKRRDERREGMISEEKRVEK